LPDRFSDFTVRPLRPSRDSYAQDRPGAADAEDAAATADAQDRPRAADAQDAQVATHAPDAQQAPDAERTRSSTGSTAQHIAFYSRMCSSAHSHTPLHPRCLVTQLTSVTGYAQRIATGPAAPSPRVPRDTLPSRHRSRLPRPMPGSPSYSAAAPPGRWSLRLVRCSRRRCAGLRSGSRVPPPGLWSTPRPGPA
jgi:hypothetical protein